MEEFLGLSGLSQYQEDRDMKRSFSLVVLAIAVAAVATMTVFAQSPQGRGPGGPGGRGFGPGGPGAPGGLPMLRQLDLTEAQREQVRAIMEGQRGQGPGKLPQLQKELQLALLADTLDPQKVDALKSGIAAATADELATRIEVESRVAQVLTPEQRAQARDLVGKMGPPNGGPGRRGRR
jgi:Spy/CpxP family protein refolding chaperone